MPKGSPVQEAVGLADRFAVATGEKAKIAADNPPSFDKTIAICDFYSHALELALGSLDAEELARFSAGLAAISKEVVSDAADG